VNLDMPVPMGRLAALGLLGAILAIVWLGVVGPLLDRYRGDRETVAFAAEQLPRLRQLASQTELLRAELDRIARDPAGQTRLLGGTSEALAGAELQNRVARDAAGHRITVRSAQVLPSLVEEGFRRITVRVTLEGNLSGLRELLYDIETAQTFLFVSDLEIRSRSGGRVILRREGQPQLDEVLAVRMDIHGYRREEAK